MYRWVTDKEFLKRAYSDCADTVNQLIQELKKYDIYAEMRVVGSKSRNMVTQNENGKIDFDFNLIINEAPGINDGRLLKGDIKLAFDTILRNSGLDDCKDSTSVLTTGDMYFKKGKQIPFSIDVCVVCKRKGMWYRLIHKKTGYIANDQWVWEPTKNSERVFEKAEYIKKHHKWLEVRERYLKKKNMYLTRNDIHHKSFICFVEAVNEVYDMIKHQK